MGEGGGGRPGCGRRWGAVEMGGGGVGGGGGRDEAAVEVGGGGRRWRGAAG